MMVVSWLQKETNCKAQAPFILQVINNMVYNTLIIADGEDHCIQGPLPLACTEKAVCIQMCDEDATCAK